MGFYLSWVTSHTDVCCYIPQLGSDIFPISTLNAVSEQWNIKVSMQHFRFHNVPEWAILCSRKYKKLLAESQHKGDVILSTVWIQGASNSLSPYLLVICIAYLREVIPSTLLLKVRNGQRGFQGHMHSALIFSFLCVQMITLSKTNHHYRKFCFKWVQSKKHNLIEIYSIQ